MTLDVHHPSPADVDPLGEGLSARHCRQRASERDKNRRFHDDVFHGCSPFAFYCIMAEGCIVHHGKFGSPSWDVCFVPEADIATDRQYGFR